MKGKMAEHMLLKNYVCDHSKYNYKYKDFFFFYGVHFISFKANNALIQHYAYIFIKF